VPIREIARDRSVSRSRRRNARLVRRTPHARRANEIASLVARLALRARAGLVPFADPRFLARVCDAFQLLSRCQNRRSRKSRSPSATKAISVTTTGCIHGDARG